MDRCEPGVDRRKNGRILLVAAELEKDLLGLSAVGVQWCREVRRAFASVLSLFRPAGRALCIDAAD